MFKVNLLKLEIRNIEDKFKEDNLSIEKPADFTIEKHKNNKSKYGCFHNQRKNLL